MISEPPYHNQPPWDVDGRNELDAEIERLRAENAKLRAALKQHHVWHMRQDEGHAVEYRDSELAAETRSVLTEKE